MERHPELPDVPTIVEMASTDEQRQVWALFLKSSTIGYSMTLTPGVPADRVAAVRKAFDAMVKDPGFIAEAGRLSLPVEPIAGEVVQETVQSLFKIEPASLAKAKAILGR
jgi:tripartite-type tricarboxylate transporter receptor subunit TctC